MSEQFSMNLFCKTKWQKINASGSVPGIQEKNTNWKEKDFLAYKIKSELVQAVIFRDGGCAPFACNFCFQSQYLQMEFLMSAQASVLHLGLGISLPITYQ